MYEPYLVSDLKTGLALNKEPWLLPQDAFATLENGYLRQGVLTKRKGYSLFGRLSHWADQDYTDYTEVDVGANRVAAIAAKITVTNLDDDEAVYVYDDFGADYFDTDTDPWIFELDFKYTDGDATCGLWSLTQDVGTIGALVAGDKNLLFVDIESDNKLYVSALHNGVIEDAGTADALVINTDYYLTITVDRSAGTLTCDIYSDVNRSMLVESISCDLPNTTDKYRYLYAQHGWGDGGGGSTWSGEIRNLTIITYPGYAVTGILHYSDASGGKQLLATDQKRLHKYNSDSRRFEDVSKADTFGGTNKDFVWQCVWNDVMYLTNGLDQQQQYDGATISALDVDYDGGGNDVDTCKMIFAYKNRLILLAPTEGTLFPQRARWCKVNDPTDWTNDEYVDADTAEWIVTAKFLGDDLIVWFEKSIWRLKYTADDTQPFIWEKIVDTEGAHAQFSIFVFPDEQVVLGPTGLVATDGLEAYPISKKIPEFTLLTATDKLDYAYAYNLKELKQSWLSFVSPAQILPDRVLVYNYLEKSWSIYYLSFLCFGFYEESDDPTFDTWEPAEETLDEVEVSFDERSSQAGYPITLAGDNSGYIWQVNRGVTDNGTPISLLVETGRWNPFGDKGLKARLGWVDFLIDADPDVSVTIEFFKDQISTYYKTATFTPTGPEGEGKVWIRIKSGEVGAFHQLKIKHSGSQQIRIHAIMPWFREAGRLISG